MRDGGLNVGQADSFMAAERAGTVTGERDGGAVVDARGHCCPIPTLRLRRALEQAAAGAVVTLLADDPLARIDVPHFAAQQGHMVEEIADVAGELRFRIRKGAPRTG